MEDMITEGPPVAGASVVAGFLWVVGLVLVLVELFSPAETGDLGVVFALGAAILTLRRSSVDVAERERAAFELGKMAGRVSPD